jgi:hypothetical protein
MDHALATKAQVSAAVNMTSCCSAGAMDTQLAAKHVYKFNGASERTCKGCYVVLEMTYCVSLQLWSNLPIILFCLQMTTMKYVKHFEIFVWQSCEL